MNNILQDIKGLLAIIGLDLLIWIFAPLFFMACCAFFDKFNISNTAIQIIFAAIGFAAVGGALLIFVLSGWGAENMKEQQTPDEKARQPQG